MQIIIAFDITMTILIGFFLNLGFENMKLNHKNIKYHVILTKNFFQGFFFLNDIKNQINCVTLYI